MQDLQAKIDFINGQIHMKRTWLSDHGPGTKKPWPESDIEAKQYHLKMLESVLGDYMKVQSRGNQ